MSLNDLIGHEKRDLLVELSNSLSYDDVITIEAMMRIKAYCFLTNKIKSNKRKTKEVLIVSWKVNELDIEDLFEKEVPYIGKEITNIIIKCLHKNNYEGDFECSLVMKPPGNFFLRFLFTEKPITFSVNRDTAILWTLVNKVSLD